MFEKEAEEYIKEHTFFDEEYGVQSLDVVSKTIFKDGAEFGYNKCKEELNQKGLALQSDMDKTIEQNIALKKEVKANEWHKQEVDDIYDLISKDWSIRYFVCIMKDKSRVTAIGNCDEGCNGEVSVNLFFDHDDEKYYLDDIVWWKEIVLPKESE